MSNEPLDYGWFFLTRRMPYDLSKPRFMVRLKEYFEDKTDADPAFHIQLRAAALQAIKTNDTDLLCRGLTALAFVGDITDTVYVEELTCHHNANVAKDARTCLFEIKQRARRPD